LQASGVLVCVYTPNFFSVERTHEFCAKEFMAFLKRDPDHRYERVVDDMGRERYAVREAHNILPIMWLSEHVLVDLNKLPPYTVRTIQYTLNFAGVSRALNDQYRAKGMSLIATQRRGTYWVQNGRRHVPVAALDNGTRPGWVQLPRFLEWTGAAHRRQHRQAAGAAAVRTGRYPIRSPRVDGDGGHRPSVPNEVKSDLHESTLRSSAR
jgi:hypothetical protein